MDSGASGSTFVTGAWKGRSDGMFAAPDACVAAWATDEIADPGIDAVRVTRGATTE